MQSTQKSLIMLGAALVVALGIYGVYTLTHITTREGGAPAPETTLTVALKGTVTAVDLSAMAFDGPARIMFETEDKNSYTIAIPSMSMPECPAKDALAAPSLIEVGDTIEVEGDRVNDGEITPCSRTSHYLRLYGTATDQKAGITFTYRKGPGGYMIHPLPISQETNPHFVRGYQLMLESDMHAQTDTSVPREGSPTIAMRIYTNPEKLWPSVWAQKNPAESNVSLMMGTETETAVGGAKAVSYVADGLYATNTYVVTQGAYVYVFTGASIDDMSPQKRDFLDIIGSVTFFPAAS